MDSTERRKEFEEQGFTVWRGFFSTAEMDELLEEIHRAQPQEAASDALDKGGLTFKHNLYRRSAYLQRFVSQQRVIDFLRPVVGPDIWVRWDQAVAKLPGGPEFPWHQDNGYNGLKHGHVQFWVAMSEINDEVGLLWLQPGSHRQGVMGHGGDGTHQVCEGDPETAVAIKAERGDVVLFSSLVLHRTSPNVGDHPRWAYVVEYMSLDEFDPYIKKPYFVVARRGRSSPEFVNVFRGRLSLRNQMMYLVPRLKRPARKARGALRRRAAAIRR